MNMDLDTNETSACSLRKYAFTGRYKLGKRDHRLAWQKD